MIGSLMASAVRLFTGAAARWRGCDPYANKPRIYFANHTSNLDFVLLWSALPARLRKGTRPAAGRDYWMASNFRRRIAEGIFNAVLIERKHVTKSNNPVEQLLEVLGGGESIIIFPEGTRLGGSSGEVGEFKSGLYHLARQRGDLEFIPVYLENLNRVLPKGEILPVPMLCSVTFGPALAILPDEPKQEFLQRSRQAILQLAQP